MMQPGLLYRQLPNGAAQCQVCQRRCVMGEGEEGWCRTRLNECEKIYTKIYGAVSSLAFSPIEKKPMFHCYPGSRWLSLGSLGCNFRCPGCQNWEIAHARIRCRPRHPNYLSPEEAVALAQREACLGISWTYNEPTLWFEYTLDSARLAKEKGLLTNYVTNGFITEEALDTIGRYLDSFRVDIKGFSQDFYRTIAHIEDFTGILRVTERARQKWGMHVEVVTNIIPGYSDEESQWRGIARWISSALGPDVPWHVTRFIPHLDLSHLPATPVEVLERARQVGLDEGLRYVYLGNVPGHPGENTYCPRCRSLLVERSGFTVVQMSVKEGRCQSCGEQIPGRFG